MSDTRPEEAELISEVCMKLWDARVQRVPHHSGVPTTLGVSTGHPSPVSTPPYAPYPPGFPNPGLHCLGFPTSGSPSSQISTILGSLVLGPSLSQVAKTQVRCVRRGAHDARTLTASWGALGADAGCREGHQATRLQPWAAGVMARPALPAATLASAPARHLEGGAARAAPPHSRPRA